MLYIFFQMYVPQFITKCIPGQRLHLPHGMYKLKVCSSLDYERFYFCLEMFIYTKNLTSLGVYCSTFPYWPNFVQKKYENCVEEWIKFYPTSSYVWFEWQRSRAIIVESFNNFWKILFVLCNLRVSVSVLDPRHLTTFLVMSS